MSLPDSPVARLIASYVDASKDWRNSTSRIRQIAELDQELAGAQDRFRLRLEDLLLSANALFALQTKLGELYRHYWYEVGGAYLAEQEQAHVDQYKSWSLDSEEILGDIERFEAAGWKVEGADEYRDNTRRAGAILEDHAIRLEAERMIPPLDRLEALADAHLRSTGN